MLAALLAAALVPAGTALAGSAPAGAVTVAELHAVYGGTCSSQCDDGSSGSTTTSPTRVGTPYWVESRRTLNSVDSTAATLADMVRNHSSKPLDHTFSYTRRIVRRVEFSGGWASAFTAKIGGEIDTSTTMTLRRTLDPYEVGKVYTRFETLRHTVYGTRYQDYSDGSRKVVARDSGPYRSGRTIVGYTSYYMN